MKKTTVILVLGMLLNPLTGQFGIMHSNTDSLFAGYKVDKRIVTAKAGLRMRNEPVQNGQVIVTIPFGAAVEVLEEKGVVETIAGTSGRWAMVIWNDNKGWVFSGFLVKEGQAAESGECATGKIIDAIIGKKLVNEGSGESDMKECLIRKDGTISLNNSGNSGMQTIEGKYQIVGESPLKLKVTVTRVFSDYGPECPNNNNPFVMQISCTGTKYIINSPRPECGRKWTNIVFIKSDE